MSRWRAAGGEISALTRLCVVRRGRGGAGATPSPEPEKLATRTRRGSSGERFGLSASSGALARGRARVSWCSVWVPRPAGSAHPFRVMTRIAAAQMLGSRADVASASATTGTGSPIERRFTPNGNACCDCVPGPRDRRAGQRHGQGARVGPDHPGRAGRGDLARSGGQVPREHVARWRIGGRRCMVGRLLGLFVRSAVLHPVRRASARRRYGSAVRPLRVERASTRHSRSRSAST